MESEVAKEGIGSPFDHLQAGSTTYYTNRLPGIPGGKSRVVLSLFPALAYETGGWNTC